MIIKKISFFNGSTDFWPCILPNTDLLLDCCCSVVKLCPALWDPMDCSPPGSSAHGISQARILEWVANSCSRDLPDLGSNPHLPLQHWQVNSLLLSHRKPQIQSSSIKSRKKIESIGENLHTMVHYSTEFHMTWLCLGLLAREIIYQREDIRVKIRPIDLLM